MGPPSAQSADSEKQEAGPYPESRSLSPEEEAHQISLLAPVNAILRHRRVAVALPLVTAALFVVLALLAPRTHTASTAFLPQSPQSHVSQLAGVAAQFGITIPQETQAESPQFYADLIQSREILKKAVETEYRLMSTDDEHPGATATLVDLYRIRRGDNQRARVEEATRRLTDDLTVSVRRETGLVELSVVTRWHWLSAQVVERLLELVNEFNLETRRSQASTERQFIESRLEEARAELEVTEDSLRLFLERNRRYENSPELRFEYDRLERRVGLRQQVYTSLSQSYEQARIEEVRNTPIITVVENPEPPVRPDRRGLVTKGLLGLFLGGVVGVFWAFGNEVLNGTRFQAPGDYAEFAHLRGEVRKDVSAVWCKFRRLWHRSSD